jgi:protoporphyrinogen IX oxidase
VTSVDSLFLIHILKWVHLSAMGFTIGVGAVCSLIAAQAVRTPGDGAALWRFYDRLNPIAYIAAFTLLISGPLLLWFRYGFAWWPPAFLIKLALIVGLVVVVFMEEAAVKRVRGGDASGVRAMDMTGYATRFFDIAIVLAAVFAFN